MQIRHHLHASALCLLTAVLCPLALAQQVAQPDAATTATTTGTTTVSTAERQLPIENPKSKIQNSDDEVVEMSVFNVTGAHDQGYAAANTTSGSRVSTPLKDIAASISPFTSEFLDDIGATTIDDLMSYAGNAEAEVEDSSNGFNNTNTRGAGNLDERFRIRGMPMSRTIDYFTYPAQADLYNVDRAEIASGPNAVLFGFGSQGGIVNFTSSRADAQRTRLRVKSTFGTWTSPSISGLPFQRYELDYNLVLMPKVFGLRLLGLYQQGGNGSWRVNMNNLDRRINPAIYIKPFKNTTINARYEAGRTKQSTSYAWNATDQLTAWLDLDPAATNNRLMQGFGSAYALPAINANGATMPSANQINSGGNNPDLVYISNNNTLADFRQAYQSVNRYSGANNGQYALPPGLFSFYYNPVGPSGLRDIKFDTANISIEQRVGNLNLELAYHHDSSNATAHSPNSNNNPLRADPNSYISASFANAPQTTGNVMPNFYPGQMYMEDTWMIKINNQRNDIVRLTADYNINLKKYGRHRLIAYFEHSEYTQYQNTLREVLADDNQQLFNPYNPNPTNTDNNPTSDGNNLITRRQYVTPGDFGTYYPGDWRTPIAPIVFNNHLWHATYATNGFDVLGHNKRTGNSAMLVWQGYLFNDRLVTTLGARVDGVSNRLENYTQLTDPSDPRILAKKYVVGEYTLDGTWNKIPYYRPYTYAAGAVYHIPLLQDRFSLFANYSTNRGLPNVNTVLVLPSGAPPPLTQGRSTDYGVMIDPLGDGKIFIRLTRFDTLRRHDASLNPGTISGDGNAALGSTNLANINTALVAAYGNDLGAFDTQGHLTAPRYTYGMFDIGSRGYELELTANPTQNLTLRLSASYSDRDRQSIYKEIIDYYNANIPYWLDLADPAKHPQAANPINIGPYQGPLLDYVKAQLYAPGDTGALVPYGGANGDTSIRQGLLDQLYLQSGPLGSRPWKFNLRVNYKFPNTLLKGFAIGGGVRYSSSNYMPNPNLTQEDLSNPPTDGTLGLDPDIYKGSRGMLTGNSLLFWDGTLRYKCKLFGGRTTMTLQFNVNNIFNQDVITMGRISQDNTWIRVYLNPPRTYRLSATFDF